MAKLYSETPKKIKNLNLYWCYLSQTLPTSELHSDNLNCKHKRLVCEGLSKENGSKLLSSAA